MTVNYATEILPDLWVGDKRCIRDTKFLKDNKFKCIVNCSKKIEINDDYMDAEYIHLMIGDKSHTDLFRDNLELYKKFDDIIKFIHKYLCQNKAVLVYCKGGLQRAPTIIAGYIMRYGKVSSECAINYIKTKKDGVFQPRVNFYLTLEKYTSL